MLHQEIPEDEFVAGVDPELKAQVHRDNLEMCTEFKAFFDRMYERYTRMETALKQPEEGVDAGATLLGTVTRMMVLYGDELGLVRGAQQAAYGISTGLNNACSELAEKYKATNGKRPDKVVN